ncbi:SDR family NAD(P)-dependent oxidoreductase [Periweissella cryptocerci]|uniref:SDR family NAD(P)-dependent oxidoreductase n=1 Tax=Periweissella cryptocerci TaxID=2506420 RepID=A0A4P6YV58_9LACO|nr:SDR family NAD(P)-dependent oxidoreductase [Periweissella cryptocerci]QBO36626.1 SDR family NAD(P)-dependent oxidoreductase [Periweissella cryptocerci]
MKLTDRNIVITGGAGGIGFAMASEFVKRGNNVVIVDYNDDALLEAQKQVPALITKKINLALSDERVQLAQWINTEFQNVDMLINVAGIQKWVNLQNMQQDWANYHNEIAINLEAPIHLISLLLPTLVKAADADIINVTSGLAVTPGTWVPIYSATKAGLRTFTEVLRLQLEDTNVKVHDILPPAVNTNLGGGGVHDYGTPLAEFNDAVFEQLANDQNEITYDTSTVQLHATKAENQEQTENIWHIFKETDTFKNA